MKAASRVLLCNPWTFKVVLYSLLRTVAATLDVSHLICIIRLAADLGTSARSIETLPSLVARPNVTTLINSQAVSYVSS